MTDASETWLPVVGYEGHYQVSDLGRIRSLDRTIIRNDPRNGPVTQRFSGKIIATARNERRNNYIYVTLYLNGKGKSLRVHRVMLEAFVGPCPPGMEGCHNNDIPDDNQLSNLRWDTKKGNMADVARNNRHPNSRKTHCKKGHELNESNTIVGNKANHRVCLTCRRRWTREAGHPSCRECDRNVQLKGLCATHFKERFGVSFRDYGKLTAELSA